MKKILTLLIIGFVIILGVWYLSNSQNESGNPDVPQGDGQNEIPGDSNGGDLTEKTYQDQQFGFSLTYPSSWEVAKEDDGIGPMITLYGTLRDDSLQAPFDHFTNETYFSVYPQGIPTEGLFGESISVAESDLNFSVALSDDSRVYILDDGTPFAAYIKVDTEAQNRNQEWNDSGYVWLRAYVENQRTRCFDAEGMELSEADCDPLTENHSVVWYGNVQTAEWNTLVRMADSFILTGNANNEDDGGGTGGNEDENITIESPNENAVVTSPLTIEGQVRGTWLFEATAPVLLESGEGEVLAESYIEADGNWMTEDLVSFSGTLTFEVPEGVENGTLIFEKANPSGLPANDASVEYSVRFK